jgi:hypothetical protein
MTMSEENKTALEQFNSFLSDDNNEENNAGYITPNIEMKLSASKRKECREIWGFSKANVIFDLYSFSRIRG